MPCCAEKPRGVPSLTLTKDIMVNAKVLHLDSSSYSQDFLSGRLEKRECTLSCLEGVTGLCLSWFVNAVIRMLIIGFVDFNFGH